MAPNAGQRRPTVANEGQRRPTKAHELGKFNAGQRRPTAANDGQRRPMQANAGPHVWALRMFFFRVLFQTNYLIQVLFSSRHSGRRPTQADEGPQQPMMANEGQRRPTKTKRGPNDASGVVWAIICFFSNVQSI